MTSVRYEASWQENQSTEIYHFSIPTPAILTGNPPNGRTSFSYIFPNISYGHHHISVDIDSGGYLWAMGPYQSFSASNGAEISFTLEAPPTINTMSPENRTYSSKSVPLLFTVDGDYASLKYSLDDLANATVDGNKTMTNLPNGSHSLTVYSNDTIGNTVASKTTYFSTSQPSVDPQYVVPILAAAFIIVLFIVIIIYIKRQPQTEKSCY